MLFFPLFFSYQWASLANATEASQDGIKQCTRQPASCSFASKCKILRNNECTNYEKPGIKDDIKELVHLRPYHVLVCLWSNNIQESSMSQSANTAWCSSSAVMWHVYSICLHCCSFSSLPRNSFCFWFSHQKWRDWLDMIRWLILILLEWCHMTPSLVSFFRKCPISKTTTWSSSGRIQAHHSSHAPSCSIWGQQAP